MKGQVKVFGKVIDYDFLAGWLKYNRLRRGYSQEALSHGICSKSHLSYFENGKKTLRQEVIEALLKKMDINEITEISSIGRLRQKFRTMYLMIETFNYEEATKIFEEICSMEEVIEGSPYNMEYRIYQLIYRSFVNNESYDDLEEDNNMIMKVYKTLREDLQHLYLFVASRILYRRSNESKYIKLLEEVRSKKETPWVNFQLGKALAYNNREVEGLYYLEKALNSYEKRGYYINAMWCHNFIGYCYAFLKDYKKAEKHLKTALNAAEFFGMQISCWHVYINLSYLHYYSRNYDLCKKYCLLAIEANPDDPVLAAYNYAEVCYRLGETKEVEQTFAKYRREAYEDNRFYPLLNYFYYKVYHFEDDIFYEKCKEIIDYYVKINHHKTTKDVRLGLIQHLEQKRKYKEATQIYRDLLSLTNFATDEFGRFDEQYK